MPGEYRSPPGTTVLALQISPVGKQWDVLRRPKTLPARFVAGPANPTFRRKEATDVNHHVDRYDRRNNGDHGDDPHFAASSSKVTAKPRPGNRSWHLLKLTTFRISAQASSATARQLLPATAVTDRAFAFRVFRSVLRPQYWRSADLVWFWPANSRRGVAE